MASVNKVILVGNLGRDPEVRHSPDGSTMCSINLATTSSWKDKNTGERRDETEWHRVSFFGRLAEVAGQYLKKGSAVYIEGRIKTRKWQDKETGQDRFSTDIIADQMQMLGGRDDSGYQNANNAPQERPARTQTPQRQPQAQSAGSKAIMDMSDDIPFACPRGIVLHVI